MSAYPSRCAIPFHSVPRDGHAGEAVNKLNLLFDAEPGIFNDGRDTYEIKAHSCEAEALAHANSHLKSQSENYSGKTYQPHSPEQATDQSSDRRLWITVLNRDEPNMYTDEAIQGALQTNSIQKFLIATANNPVVAQLDEHFYADNVLPSLLRDTLLFEPAMEACQSLPETPDDMGVDLEFRGYVKRFKSIDPVKAILVDNEPYAVNDALNELNAESLASWDHEAIEQALRHWDEDQRENASVALEMLGFTVEECAERMREILSDQLAFTGGSTNLNPSGEFALILSPQLNNQDVQINFDGITSSQYNAVIDEHYFAMLDTLKVDVRGWIRHLAEQAGLGTPSWSDDTSLKMLIDEHRNGQFLKDALIESLFFGSDDKDITDQKWNTADYLFDIALEVLKPQAERLDEKWLQGQGIDLLALSKHTNSKQQLAEFPQLAESPNYFLSLANLGTHGDVTYDWSHSPDQARTEQLINNQDLSSILDNCSYDGTIHIAFTCDYDDLLKIHKWQQGDGQDKLKISGAYFHVHSYTNGAGDGEPLRDTITINACDIGSKWSVMNDAAHRYGINETFGQFLATKCTVSHTNPEIEEIKAANIAKLKEEGRLTLG